MDASDLKKVLSHLEQAQLRLGEAIRQDASKNEFMLDATIQRFEFTFELCWKTLKRFLQREGVTVKSPRETFKEAFKLGWLAEGDTFWSKLIDDRNLATHTYDQKLAKDLYSRIPGYDAAFARLIAALKSL